MREKVEGRRWVWGWVHCPQVRIIHACVLVVTRRAGVQRQGGRGCAQCNLVEDWEVYAAINIAVQAQMELEGQEPPAHLTRVEPKKMQAVRAESRLGKSALDSTQPGQFSMS